MDSVENDHGNILVYCLDRWKNKYYLTSDLKFTTENKNGARFYFLKQNDEPMSNGDKISFNIGNRTLTIDSENNIKMMPREKITNENTQFLVRDGTDNTDALKYSYPYFIVSDEINKKALHCKIDFNKKVRNFSDNISLSNETIEENKDNYVFGFERYIVNCAVAEETEDNNSVKLQAEKSENNKGFSLDGYKEMLLILLILILIILCILINR